MGSLAVPDALGGFPGKTRGMSTRDTPMGSAVTRLAEKHQRFRWAGQGDIAQGGGRTETEKSYCRINVGYTWRSILGLGRDMIVVSHMPIASRERRLNSSIVVCSACAIDSPGAQICWCVKSLLPTLVLRKFISRDDNEIADPKLNYYLNEAFDV